MTEIKAGTGTSRNTGETKEIACSQAHYKPLNAACGNRKGSARPPPPIVCEVQRDSHTSECVRRKWSHDLLEKN